MSYDVFISYASEDRGFAETLHSHLVQRGFTVWFDKARLEPGFDWHKAIEDGCENSRVFLPVLTPQWKRSEWTKYETYGAESVIPLVFEGDWNEVCTPPLVRFQMQSLDVRDAGLSTWDKLAEAIQRELRKAPSQKADRLAHVLHFHNPSFVGREAYLNNIHEILFANPTTLLTQGRICAITAAPGRGKTASAREYAEKFWRCYRQIFWIDCRVGVVPSLASLYSSLFATGASPALDDFEKARRVLAEFRRPDAPQRLLIYDDAPDQDSVALWLPNSGSSHTIVTSLFTSWVPPIEWTPLWVLDQESARALLLKRASRDWGKMRYEEQAACDELARQCDFLPLTLERAAAYISRENPSFGFRDYLRLSKEADQARRLHQKSRRRESVSYPDSVFDTWHCIVPKLPAEARAILRLACFLSRAPIPFAMFLRRPDLIMQTACGLDPSSDTGDAPTEVTLRDCKAALASYSMITLDVNDCFCVDGLLQEVERQDVSEEDTPAWSERAMSLLAAYAPVSADRMESWPVWRTLLPHAQALWGQARKDSRIAFPPDLLTELAAHLNARGRYAEAEGPARMDVDAREKAAGDDSVALCTSLDLLGTALGGIGRFEEAEPCYRRALEGRERILGPRHRHTLASLNNLAGLLLATGQSAEAEKYYRRSWDGCMSNPDLGPLHEDTIGSAINLARALTALTRYDEAERIYEQTLPECESVLGRERRETIVCLNGLASLLDQRNEVRRAEELYRRAVETAKASLGPNHPDTCLCMENLAWLLSSQQRFGEAESLYREALQGRESSQGAGHRDAYDCLSELAKVLEQEGKADEARKMLTSGALAVLRTGGTAYASPVLASLFRDLKALLERMGLGSKAILADLNDIGRPFNVGFEDTKPPSL